MKRFSVRVAALFFVGSFAVVGCSDAHIMLSASEDGGALDTGTVDAGMPGTDSGTDGGRVDAATAPVVCELAWNATPVGGCDAAPLGYRWNGEYCEQVYACSCEGDHCGLVRASPDAYACYEQHRANGCFVYNFVVATPDGNQVTESGDSVRVVYGLTRRPTADVNVTMMSSDGSEGAVTPSAFTFTPTSDATTTLTVTGVDDTDHDGNQRFFVHASVETTDPAHSGPGGPTLYFTNVDNDTNAIVVSPMGRIALVEGGEPTVVSVRLSAMPDSDVAVQVSTSEEVGAATATPSSIVFTPANWDVPQTVEIAPVDDALADGATSFHVYFSPVTEGTFSAEIVALDGTTYDDESRELMIEAEPLLITREANVDTDAIFRVRLSAAPSANVSFPIMSTDEVQGYVSSAYIVVSTTDWDSWQEVRVSGFNDGVLDGDTDFQVVISASESTDPLWDGIPGATLAVRNLYVPHYIKASTPSASESFGTELASSRAGDVRAIGWPAAERQIGNVLVYGHGGGVPVLDATLRGSNTERGDSFGSAVDLSSDGVTLAVGAYGEGSNSTEIDGDQSDNSLHLAGAVYVFQHNESGWEQLTYIKPSAIDEGDAFGSVLALSADGNTLAVASTSDDSVAAGVNGDAANDDGIAIGGVFVFARSGSTWTQQAYLKASNPGDYDQFGTSLAISGDGATLVVGTTSESSAATGIDGDGSDDSAPRSGAAYVFTRVGSTWSQQAYVKPSNTHAEQRFGAAFALSNDGNLLAVGASSDAGSATGIDGAADPVPAATGAGAVFLFERSGATWSQSHYIKASNSRASTQFGSSVDLSDDGNSLLVGAIGDSSAATRIMGNEADTSAPFAGAAYLFSRASGSWAQTLYIKAPNAEANDFFGVSVLFSSFDSELLVSANGEAGGHGGIDGDWTDNSARYAGAVYNFF